MKKVADARARRTCEEVAAFLKLPLEKTVKAIARACSDDRRSSCCSCAATTC